jgi:hypothetical protein
LILSSGAVIFILTATGASNLTHIKNSLAGKTKALFMAIFQLMKELAMVVKK